MTERVDIVNLALVWLGEQPVSSIEDDSERARVMKANYSTARDATLEKEEWSFAIKRFTPAILEQTPDPRYYAYEVPADILRVLTVESPNHGSVGWIPRAMHEPMQRTQVEWVLEDGMILSRAPEILCRGIRRTPDEGSFSNLFVNALAARLAYQCAMPLTNSRDAEQLMAARFAQYTQEAESRDGQQGRSQRIRNRSMRWAR